MHLATMNAIIPVPAAVRSRAGTLTLAGDVTIAVPSGRRDFATAAELFVRSTRPLTGLTLRVTGSGRGRIVLREAAAAAPEGYELSISVDGVEVAAFHPTGAFYGLQSLAQLLPLHASAAELPCLHIRDEPRFPWRGVLLDSARHFFTPQEVRPSSIRWRATS